MCSSRGVLPAVCKDMPCCFGKIFHFAEALKKSSLLVDLDSKNGSTEHILYSVCPVYVYYARINIIVSLWWLLEARNLFSSLKLFEQVLSLKLHWNAASLCCSPYLYLLHLENDYHSGSSPSQNTDWLDGKVMKSLTIFAVVPKDVVCHPSLPLTYSRYMDMLSNKTLDHTHQTYLFYEAAFKKHFP